MTPQQTSAEKRVLLTVEEVAQCLGIGRTLCWSLVHQGEIPSMKLGRLVRVHRVALEAWLAAQAASSNSSTNTR